MKITNPPDEDHGYIRLHRRILSSSIIKKPTLFHFWIWCLLKATHCEYKTIVGYQEITLQPGQFIFGRYAASKETGLSERCIRTCIKTLKSTGNMTIKTTNKFSIITICNWGKYQNTEHINDQHNDRQYDQQATSKRPASDHKQEHKEHKEEKETTLAQSDKKPIAHVPPPDIFISIPVIKNSKTNEESEYFVTLGEIEELEELYPAVDVKQEFREMRAWCLANSRHRKTLGGVKRFYNSWLAKEQDRARPSQATGTRQPDRWNL